MRWIFDLKSWGMLLLRTGFVNYFNQDVFVGIFRMKQKYKDGMNTFNAVIGDTPHILRPVFN
jgi:hypothetical protein